MAKAKVTIEALTQMANILRQSADDIMTTKEQMDNALHSFPWDDPIGLAFIGRYEEDFKPLKEKLIPNIEDYIQYMNQEGMIVSEYSGESAGGFGASGAVGAGAMGVGVGVAGAARINSNSKKSNLFPNPSGSINTDSNKKTQSEFEDPLDYVITDPDKMGQSEFKDPLDYVITDPDKMGQSEFPDPLDLIGKGSPVPPPPVFETDQSSIRVAASEILEEMTEKDLFIDSKEVQNQISDKTDEIFKNKYNTSLNEIGLNSGFNPEFNPETNGYYEDHNTISEELRNEVAKMKEKFEPTPIRHMDNDAVYAELSPEDKRNYDDRRSKILELKEHAEFQKKIADTDAHYDGWEGVKSAKMYDSFRGAWAVEDIVKADGELQELEKWAREAVRNNRNQKIADYISNSRK